jgi:hypothetical protein
MFTLKRHHYILCFKFTDAADKGIQNDFLKVLSAGFYFQFKLKSHSCLNQKSIK